MPTKHLSTSPIARTTDDARGTSDALLEALERWREADRSAAPTPLAPRLRAIDAHRVVIEQARAELMRRNGIDSYQAFAVMVRWSRATHTPVHRIAQTLLDGPCEANPRTQLRQRMLRWLEGPFCRVDPST